MNLTTTSGGSYVNEYLYDSFNRLSEAKGTFGGTQTYQVAMDYNEAGGITNKHQTVAGGFANTFAYNNAYTYDPQKPHQLVGLTNAAVGSGQPFETGFAWNASGSMRAVAVRPSENDSHDTIERYVYNEEQWMMGHVNEQTYQYTHFVYDHKGERILKGSINTASLSTNGQSPALSLTMDPYTLYLNPFYVAVQRNQMDQVSKHYYYNGQRFATKTGFYLAPISPLGEMSSMGNTALAKNLEATITELGFTDSLSWSTQSSSPPDTNVAHYPRLMYYYHPDYLGHVEYITDLDGTPYQYFYYTAWGETLLDQKASRPGMNFDSPYRFNGKELDEETGLYYYGARYYNPTVSVWLGVDPKAYAFPHVTSYNFLLNNPIMMVDPGGDSTEFYNTQGKHLYTSHDGLKNAVTVIPDDGLKGFMNIKERVESGELKGTDENWQHARDHGVSYIVNDYYDFFDSNQDQYQGTFFDPTDGKGPLINEASAQLLYINGEMKIGGKMDLDGNPGGCDLYGGEAGVAHTHPNEGRNVYVETLGYRKMEGNSGDISRSRQTGKGSPFFDIVIYKDKINFYNNTGNVITHERH